MSDSPAATSPLIDQANEVTASGEDLNGCAGAVIDVPGISAQKEVELKGRPREASRPGWSMRYHDIVSSFPDAKNKTFRELVDQANDWLARNDDVMVKSCETVFFYQHGDKRPADTEYMILSYRFAKDREYQILRFLRLWLVPRKQDEKQTKLRYTVISPEAGDMSQSVLADRLNDKIKNGEISGRILKICTELLPADDNKKAQTEVVGWMEHTNDDELFAYCLTVFLLDDGSTPSCVEMKDFLPKETVDGFESYERVTDRANNWMKEQADARLLCIQSFEAHKLNDSTAFLNCHLLRQSVQTIDSTETVRTVRIFVTRGNELSGFSCQKGVAFENFLPKAITVKEAGSMKERGERMAEVFHRLTIYLETSDLEVLGLETAQKLAQMLDKGHNETDLDCKVILYLRVFVTNESAMKRKRSLSRTGSQRRQGSFRRSDQRAAKKKQSGNSEHPGPIFLRNVVNRRFKYRYLAFGVAGFVAMSIIVVVSVVYSNT